MARGDRRVWRRIFRRAAHEELDEELRFHLEERVRDYIARGLEPDAARRAALERLGDLDPVRRECATLLDADRRARDRRRSLHVSWLDVKLGVRMLAKYPGLSSVAVVGMAVAIAIGAGWFTFFSAMLDPHLPLPGGDRIVSIATWDARVNRLEEPSAGDFVLWRERVRSVGDVGAYRDESLNLVAAGGATELVEVAAITASAFRVARTPAVIGRPILEDDERAGAPGVIVIAYEEWQRRFGGDPSIIGTVVRLGDAFRTIVGVMPEGFRFPLNHRLWIPLRVDPVLVAGEGPPVHVFGRLAEDATMDAARTELVTIGQGMAAAFPETHEHLRPRVLPYTWAFMNIDSPGKAMALRSIYAIVALLLVIVSANVSILVYARTTARAGEIAIRSALGASRSRIVMQLFMEALALSVIASLIGLTIAGVGLRMVGNFQDQLRGLPFWVDLGLTPRTVAYAAGLAIIAGAIIGVLPGLKATGRNVQAGLQRLAERGSRMELGRMWTALIVLQVAIAVAGLPVAIQFCARSLDYGLRRQAPAATEMVRATLQLEPSAAGPADGVAPARLADRAAELIRRVRADPRVGAVTFSSHFPGWANASRIEIEPVAGVAADSLPSSALPRWARTNRIDVALLDVFDVPPLAGRALLPADVGEEARTTIVNAEFARRMGGIASTLGRRVRTVAAIDGEGQAAPWLEIVGVIPDFDDDFTMQNTFDAVPPRLYTAADLEGLDRVDLAVRVRDGHPERFTQRLRDMAAAIDPTLRLERMESVTETWHRGQLGFRALAILVVAIAASVLLLSAAGIHAMMSFTVSRRRREIGIRSALGADARHLLAGVFARAVAQLGAGAAVGLALAVIVDRLTNESLLNGRSVILVPVVVTIIVAIGVLAALGPARRGLSIQPVEALRAE